MDGLAEILQQLIDFVKTASPLLWAILVKQAFVQGIQNSIWALLALILTIICIWGIIKLARLCKQESEEFFGWMAVTLGFLGCIILGVFLYNFTEAIGRFINPEYYAILNIIGQIK